MKKLIALILCLALLAVPLVGCGHDNVIKVNEVTHSLFYAPLYAAIELDYFDEAGYKIELTNGGGSDASMTAVLTGEAEIGLMGPETTIYVYNEGRKDYAQVFGQLTKRDGAFLVGRNSEPNFNWTNLANKHILMGRRGGMPAMTLQWILNQKGYTNGQNITMDYDVQFNLLGPSFINGTGDYVTLFEPTASQLVLENNLHIVASIGKEGGEVPYTSFIALKSYIEKNDAKLESFLDCIYRATKYIAAHTDEQVAQLLSPQFFSTPLNLLTAALKNYRDCDAWYSTPVLPEAAFNRMQDIMENAGELTKRAPYASVVNNSIAEKIGK